MRAVTSTSRSPSAAGPALAALGERLEEVTAASRGSPPERQEARQNAVSLKRDMQRLEQDLQRCGAPERTVVAVSVFHCVCLCPARARAAAPVRSLLLAGIYALKRV